MGKLGKKARKFAQKNLQSVLKKRRKFKSMRDSFRRKSSARVEETSEDLVEPITGLTSGGTLEGTLKNAALANTSLEMLFDEDDSDFVNEGSDSDGFLSEDENYPCFSENKSENGSEEMSADCASKGQNEEIHHELMEQKWKLDRLREKDPKFSAFLEKHKSDLEKIKSKDTSSDEEDETGDQDATTVSEGSRSREGRLLTSYMVDAWFELVVEKKNMSVLPNLLNGFRAACLFETDGPDSTLYYKIQSKETFCKILMCVLQEADSIFCKLLGITNSGCKRENIVELVNSSKKWKIVKPLISSYLRSTLYLLNQITDSQILEFTLSRIRSSIIYLAAFPSLTRRVIKVAVLLWVTGGGSLSASAFSLLWEMAVQLDSDFLDTIFIRAYKAFIAKCKFVDATNLRHIQLLRDFISELYSINIQKSYDLALSSIQQLTGILQNALRTKKKEALKKIYNWQYMNCIHLWVDFISNNAEDHNLQKLLYLVIQITNGVAHLFTGPRYLPLRLKCIQMLNQLSNATGVFIPVAFLVLSSLEYKGSLKVFKPGPTTDISLLLKVPKHLLKSQDFHYECLFSAIEMLAAHFAQWSYHISFPEIATIPLIRLKQIQQNTIVDSLRRSIQCLVDQVEQNVQFVQKKREDVAFSPKDQTAVDSFLQLERSGGNARFTRYYTGLLQKSVARNLAMNEKLSLLEGKKQERKKQRK
ncbi:protein REBELOTE isoform X2 [Aristolochia californica]|uniref:protein REBELOTE isoform X2 n=1 Tax=Aristolochia californica TaxID=171875 RepID=UPI0035DADC01